MRTCIPLLPETNTEHRFHRDIHKGNAGGFRQERYASGSPRVYFYDVNIVLFIYDELNIVQPDDAYAASELLRIFTYFLFYCCRDGERRIHTHAVTRVHPGPLDQLHDPRQEHVCPVADRIHFHFLARDVFIHQHRPLCVQIHRLLQVGRKRLFVRGDLHRSSAQHKAWTHKHGIADQFRLAKTLLDIGHCRASWAGYLFLVQDPFKGVSVLRRKYCLRRSSDNAYTPLMQRLGQIHGGLAAQRGDDAQRFFQIDDVHDVLDSQRFKIELVRGGIIGGYGLRVIVDHDRLVTQLLYGPYRVNGGIVELHTLAYPDRTRAQHDDLFPVRNDGLVFLLVC